MLITRKFLLLALENAEIVNWIDQAGLLPASYATLAAIKVVPHSALDNRWLHFIENVEVYAVSIAYKRGDYTVETFAQTDDKEYVSVRNDVTTLRYDYSWIKGNYYPAVFKTDDYGLKNWSYPKAGPDHTLASVDGEHTMRAAVVYGKPVVEKMFFPMGGSIATKYNLKSVFPEEKTSSNGAVLSHTLFDEYGFPAYIEAYGKKIAYLVFGQPISETDERQVISAVYKSGEKWLSFSALKNSLKPLRKNN